MPWCVCMCLSVCVLVKFQRPGAFVVLVNLELQPSYYVACSQADAL